MQLHQRRRQIAAPIENITIRELWLSAGAEFIVAVCGDIMIMPGLPVKPAAETIFVNEKG